MATVSTGQVETSSATGTRPRRSSWLLVWNLSLVLSSGVIWLTAVDPFRNGVYAWGYLEVVLALGTGLNGLGFLIAGRSLEKEIGDFLGGHPRFHLTFSILLIIALFAWLVCFKNEKDQRRALAYQTRIQAAQPVKEAR